MVKPIYAPTVEQMGVLLDGKLVVYHMFSLKDAMSTMPVYFCDFCPGLHPFKTDSNLVLCPELRP